MVKVTSLIVKAGSGLRSSFGVRAWIEMEIRCVKSMHRLKVVSCGNNSGFKGLAKHCTTSYILSSYYTCNLFNTRVYTTVV